MLGDVFASNYNIGEEIKIGSLVAVADAGAYCESLAATAYCSRPRPAEVLVGSKQSHLVRERETIDDVVRKERAPPAGLVIGEATVEEANEDNVSQSE